MKLSHLEEDLIGDLAQDDHEFWEVFGFVRRHHPNADNSEVLRLGRDLIESWNSREWIEVIGDQGVVLSGPALAGVLKRMTSAEPSSPEGGFKLILKKKAYAEVPWLASAT